MGWKVRRGDTPPPQHNYLKKLLRLQAQGALPLTAGVHDVAIAHDDWCGIYRGKHCHCDPDITLKTLWQTRPQG